MNSSKRIFGLVLMILLVISLFPLAASASTYGLVDSSSIWVYPTEFVPGGFGRLVMHPSEVGYWIRSYDDDTITQIFWAPVKLPSGVVIDDIVFYYYDRTGAPHMQMDFLKHYTDNDNQVLLKRATSDSTGGGYGSKSLVVNYKLTPEAYWNEVVFDNYNQYYLRVSMPFISIEGFSDLAFKGVRISYKRQVGDPPGTATFSDVNPSMQFFPYVEALAASGITTGYSDGTFKPNDYVTRGQMAAFLTRALGLHHPDE